MFYKKALDKNNLFKIMIGLIIILILSIIVLASVPPVSRDALIHHLAVPKLYIEHGGIYEIPYMSYSYYPMNIDLLYMVPLFFNNDIVPKYIHFVFAILTAGLIFSYLDKRLNRLWGLLGVLFFLSIPIIVKLSITVYVDLGLIFFSTASLIFLLKWIETSFSLRHIVLSAVFCGLALGSKYNALIQLLLLALFIPFFYIHLNRTRQKETSEKLARSSAAIQFKGLLLAIVFVFVALLIYSPWMVRNYSWTKNPVYPLYQSFFQKPDKDSVSENRIENRPIKIIGGPKHFTIRKVIFKETWLETALIPLRIFFSGKDGDPKYFDGKLNPFLCLLPFLAFIGRKEERKRSIFEKKILLLFAVLFLLLAYFQTDMRIRYVGPIIPPLVILSIFGLHGLFVFIKDRPTGWVKNASAAGLFFAVSLMFIFNFIYILEQFRSVDPVSYISGKISRDEYIEKRRPEYRAMQFANTKLSGDIRILGMFIGNRYYYCERDIIVDEKMFKYAVEKSNSSEDILFQLQKSGVTHMLIGYNRFLHWLSFSFNAEEKRMIEKLFQDHIRLLFKKGGYRLYDFSGAKNRSYK